jgi:Xaa-Pro aminopeptidase
VAVCALSSTASRTSCPVDRLTSDVWRLGVGGALIEDTVLVTNDGAEILTTLSRDLIVLDPS